MRGGWKGGGEGWKERTRGCGRGVQQLDIRDILNTYWTHTGHTLDTHWTHTEHTLDTHTHCTVLYSIHNTDRHAGWGSIIVFYGKHHTRTTHARLYKHSQYSQTAKHSQTQPSSAKHSTMCRQTDPTLNADWAVFYGVILKDGYKKHTKMEIHTLVSAK